MAYTFKVSTDDLDRAAGVFDGHRQKCVQLARDIVNVGGTLKGSWKGDAADAFYKKLCDVQGDISDIQKIIDEHVKDLRAISQKYKTSESNTQSAVSGLSSDVINY